MHKVWAVIRREFVERVRSKWFWISALLGPVFFGVLIFLPILLAAGGAAKRVAVVDGTTSGVGARVTAALGAGRSFLVERVPAGAGVVDSLTAAVGDKRLDGFLLVDDALVEKGQVEYRSSNVSALRAIGELQRTLSAVALSARLERAGVDPAVVARAQIRVDLATKKISGGKTTGESTGQSFTLAYVMALVLFMAIFLYGANVMGSVLEEKTSRVVEVLVSSLRPFQLMLGKVAGVGAVSLFQFLIWGLSAWALVSQRRALTGRMAGADEAGDVFQLPPVTLETAALFLAFFLGGFLLYAAMFAVVGAISSTEQEARQAQQPVTFLLMIAYLSMFAMMNDPEGTLAVTLSLVPFTSPIAMPVRWAAGSLPPGELALSLALLGLGIVVVTWAAARIYRVGILMTGKRPGLRELVRWVRAT